MDTNTNLKEAIVDTHSVVVQDRRTRNQFVVVGDNVCRVRASVVEGKNEILLELTLFKDLESAELSRDIEVIVREKKKVPTYLPEEEINKIIEKIRNQ